MVTTDIGRAYRRGPTSSPAREPEGTYRATCVVEVVRTDAEHVVASFRDPSQFAVIFDRHFDAIHGYLVRRSGRDVADELAAETFRVAFEIRHRYDIEYSGSRPWLYGIATRLLARHRRSRERGDRARARIAVQVVEPSLLEDLVVGHVDAEVAIGELKKLLSGLPEGDRDVLLLFAWEELTYEEIATALDIPVGTVRSRLHRARRCCRELLEETGQSECGISER